MDDRPSTSGFGPSQLRRHVCCVGVALTALACGPRGEFGPGHAALRSPSANAGLVGDRLARFAPKPDGRDIPIDYDGIDATLDAIVLNIGPSLRQRAGRPAPTTGSHFIVGHDSPYRLEGNKVYFSRLRREHTTAIDEAGRELVEVGDRMELSRLPPDQQLSYWFNLHNMVVIREIAARYPIRVPRRITVAPSGRPFHTAPLVTIKGVALSLEDIRSRIVFRHWSDPRVFYGFFHGDLASPNVRNRAFRPASVWNDLDENAREFVNSLRGVYRSRDAMRVSPLYEEAKGALFPRWPDDLKAHLSQFARSAVARILRETTTVRPGRYEGRIADLVGGQPFRPMSQVQNALLGGQINASPALVRMVREVQKKFDELERRRRRGTVTIVDDPPPKEGE